jgi:hypothetical protein
VGTVLAALLVLSGGVYTASLLGDDPVESSNPPLASCERSDKLFPTKGKQTLEHWQDLYRVTVKEVLEAHDRPRIAQCTEAGGDNPPTDELKILAASLPPWQKKKSFDALIETDMPAVLLEYQRLYECALNERLSFLLPTVVSDMKSSDGSVNVAPLKNSLDDEQANIQQELALTRPVLHRVLGFVGASNRLSPLVNNLECLERASLDIRNALGLAADASACLPRAWDARGSLRDF